MPDGIGLRLENFFWRIWSHEETLRNIKGRQVGAIFAKISEGGTVRTTPTQSPRVSRNLQTPQPSVSKSSTEGPLAVEGTEDTAQETPKASSASLGGSVPRQPASILKKSRHYDSSASFEEKPTLTESQTQNNAGAASYSSFPTRVKPTFYAGAGPARRRPIVLRRKSSSQSSSSSTSLKSSVRSRNTATSISSMSENSIGGADTIRSSSATPPSISDPFTLAKVEEDQASKHDAAGNDTQSGTSEQQSLILSNEPSTGISQRSRPSQSSLHSLPSLLRRPDIAPALAATYQATGTMDLPEQSTNTKRRKARVGFSTADSTPLKPPGPSAPGEDVDGPQEGPTDEGLERSRSQLALLLERGSRFAKS